MCNELNNGLQKCAGAGFIFCKLFFRFTSHFTDFTLIVLRDIFSGHENKLTCVVMVIVKTRKNIYMFQKCTRPACKTCQGNKTSVFFCDLTLKTLNYM